MQTSQSVTKVLRHRSPLKWAGGKFGLLDRLDNHLPAGKRLVEPFVGSAVIFLNLDYDEYLLCDVNPDLINLYNHIKEDHEKFITDLKEFFTPEMNVREEFLRLRDEFNTTTDTYFKSLLFVYLNRHCFNGLCRYNKKGKFNVSFGAYTKPYFPEEELRYFGLRAKKATFKCQGFRDTFAEVKKTDAVYADPPYVPSSATANFVSYSTEGFTKEDQEDLAALSKGSEAPLAISNHDNEITRELYKGMVIESFPVKRTISCLSSSRKPIGELIAKKK